MDANTQITVERVRELADRSELILMDALNTGNQPQDIAMLAMMVAARAVRLGLPRMTRAEQMDLLHEGIEPAYRCVEALG